jgi:hypothetical protein
MEMNRVNDEQTWRLVQEKPGLLRLLLEEVDRQRSDLVRSLTTSDVHDPGFFQELDTFSTQLSGNKSVLVMSNDTDFCRIYSYFEAMGRCSSRSTRWTSVEDTSFHRI